MRGRGGLQRDINMRGGFQRNINNRGVFQHNPNNRGGFQQNPNNRGGFQQNPNNRGGFQQNSNNRGGFQQNPIHGSFQHNSNGNSRGGFQQNVIRGGFQQNPNNRGGFQQNPNNRGGFLQSANNRGTFQKKTNVRGGFQKNTNVRGGFQKNTNVSGGFQKTINPGGFRGNVNTNPDINFAVTGLGNVKSFDVHQRLGPKVTFDARQKLKKKTVDARQKITGPGTNIIKLNAGPSWGTQNVFDEDPDFQFVKITPPGEETTVGLKKTVVKKITAPENDARKKIVKIQIQKGTFDARSRISSKVGDSQLDGSSAQVNVPGMGDVSSVTRNVPIHDNGFHQAMNVLTKTVTNVDSPCIQVTDSGLQVTRNVPSSSIMFDGSSLKVTKRAQAIESLELVSSSTEKASTINMMSQYSRLGGMNYLDNEEETGQEEEMFHMPMNITRTTNIVKTVSNPPVASVPDVMQTSNFHQMLKRKSSVPECSGPLKLLKTGSSNYTPSIRVPSMSKSPVTAVQVERMSPVKKPAKPVVKSTSEVNINEDDSVGELVSPLQGYRVYVTNLHPVVNQDDIIELFGAIGALKKAKLIKPGIAEVVYLNKDDAHKAVVKYNNRELDGQVMKVKLLTSAQPPASKPTPPPPSPVAPKAPTAPTPADYVDEALPAELKSQPLKLRKQVPVSSLGPEPSNIQLPVLHKALFKLGTPGGSNPVTFTVKI